jgi:hypothetical protein
MLENPTKSSKLSTLCLSKKWYIQSKKSSSQKKAFPASSPEQKVEGYIYTKSSHIRQEREKKEKFKERIERRLDLRKESVYEIQSKENENANVMRRKKGCEKRPVMRNIIYKMVSLGRGK